MSSGNSTWALAMYIKEKKKGEMKKKIKYRANQNHFEEVGQKDE